MIINTHQKFYLVFFQQTIWTVNISPHFLAMMNTVNTEFCFAQVWFTDQASKALEIEDNVNLALIIKMIKIYQDLLLKNGLRFMINQEEITMLIKKLESKHQC